MSRVIGIDLGTTNSVVSLLDNNRPEVIQNAEGYKTTPSIVHFPEEGEVVVGDLARRQLIVEPKRTVHSVKRFMGCRWDEIEERKEGIFYDLVSDQDGMATVKIGSKNLRPEDISAEVLIKMKRTAEAFLGEAVENAIITVPAHFNDSQRTATKLAAEKAGLNALRLVNEPTAAALAYGLGRDKRQLVAIFDFGGGTFDITILEIEGDIYEVKSTGGDTYLGGDNINHLMVDWISDEIQKETGIDPRQDIRARQQIAETAEKVKCELSTLTKTLISLPFIVSDDSGPKHFSADITRKEFEELIEPLTARLRGPCETALADAGITREDLSAVILVGGSTRIPKVRELVEEIFDRKPDTSVNPDEVVACGAAIQGGIMTGDLDEILLLDVTPLSLGIEVAGDIFSTIIPRNSNVPTTVGKKFTTVVDNQDTVKVHVLQGERKIASRNRSLSHFRLTGIPQAPKEIPEVEVSFHIDANGILTVSAMDLTSGESEEIQVESYSGGTEVAADQVVAGVDAAAEEDRAFLQKAAVRERIREMEATLDG
ncbi:molecular chaperone DnaK, partial [Candidatus Sumerlaeota bacterium]|nr:molecular chaperone DnaK [Candidatus Sumerlaeota bacterium]